MACAVTRRRVRNEAEPLYMPDMLICGGQSVRYLRLWKRFAIIAFVREAEYRVNFLIGVGEGIAEVVLAILTFLLLFRFTGTVAGWTSAQVLVLVGIYRVVDGVIGMQVAPNMLAVSGYIRRGEMD